jgi:competence protein ComEC
LDEPQEIQAATNIQNVAGVFRKSLSSLTYENNPSDAAALLPGLVVGDNSAQSDALVNNLRISGLGHLTAVSGANVAILLLFVQFVLRRTNLSDKWRFAILILVLIAFVIVARPSASVVRAAMMASITLVYWIKGMQKLSEGILFLAVIVLILVDPWLSLSWGLALSAAATLGLIVLPRFWGVDEKSGLLLKLTSTALAASLATMPILFLMGSPITFATLPANILAEILIGPATILGLTAPLINLLPGLGVFASILANLAVGVAALIVGIATYFSHSVFAIPVISVKGFLLISLLLLGFKFRKQKHLAILLAGTIVITFFAADRISSRWQIEDWEIAVCDIGQGDATLIRTAEHSAMLVDAGPDSEAMKECLELYKVENIDLFVASHFHADHVAGIFALSGNLKPKRVITAVLNAPNSGVDLVEKMVAPVKRENGYLGMSGSFNDSNYQVTWQVLAPTNPVIETSDDDGSQINNNSVVLQVNTNHHRVLLTGDIEVDGQNNLMNSIGQLDVDLVKVPHHGSAYQSPGFAKWTSASLAWISVGEGNSYGHPNANTILMYQSAGSKVLTTLECGYLSFGRDAFSSSRGCV